MSDELRAENQRLAHALSTAIVEIDALKVEKEKLLAEVAIANTRINNLKFALKAAENG
jgi:hypothetical protein